MTDMTESSPAVDQQSKRYPLSFTQEWFVTLDQGEDGGTFGPRFIMVRAMRVTGPVDVAVLQGSLDDLVARHELLRTLVVRDADPPYQRVLPPCHVPLEVRDLTPGAGKSRDLVAQELKLEAEVGSIGCLVDEHHSPRPRSLLYGAPLRYQSEQEQHDIPSGAVWFLGSGPDELTGYVLYNLDEFRQSTIQGWATGLRRILAGGASEPDKDWRLLFPPRPSRRWRR
jgi:hypothetical protein